MRRLSLILASILLLGVASTSQAQNVLTYGTAVQGTLNGATPTSFFSFSGTAGDLVTVRATALVPGLDPTLSLLSPASQPLANNDNDPLVPGTANASLSYRLAESGTYSILVGTASGEGNFLLSLDARPAAISNVLNNTAPTTVNIPQGAPSQVYSFTGGLVSIASATPGFGYIAEIRDASGKVAALVDGATLQTVTLSFNAEAGPFELLVTAADPAATGSIVLSLEEAVLLDVPVVPDPATTEEPSSGQQPVAGLCQITPTNPGGVNVRAGNSTAYEVVGGIGFGEFATALGESNLWFQVRLSNGVVGWVSDNVVNEQGDACLALPVLQPPPPPTATPVTVTPETSTPETATAETETPTEETETATTETETPTEETETATAETETPTEETPTEETQEANAQIAPEDSPSNTPLNVELDGSASSADFVSYPGGDREDRVQYRVSGMNNNVALPGGQADLIITANCNGTGSQNIQFFVDGRTAGCGELILQRLVTADSNSGQVTITATGGEDTYIQWTLTATANRTN